LPFTHAAAPGCIVHCSVGADDPNDFIFRSGQHFSSLTEMRGLSGVLSSMFWQWLEKTPTNPFTYRGRLTCIWSLQEAVVISLFFRARCDGAGSPGREMRQAASRSLLWARRRYIRRAMPASTSHRGRGRG